MTLGVAKLFSKMGLELSYKPYFAKTCLNDSSWPELSFDTARSSSVCFVITVYAEIYMIFESPLHYLPRNNYTSFDSQINDSIISSKQILGGGVKKLPKIDNTSTFIVKNTFPQIIQIILHLLVISFMFRKQSSIGTVTHRVSEFDYRIFSPFFVEVDT